jgi:hypothetical protein
MAESRFEDGHLNLAGKEVRGSDASGGDLFLKSTTHATKGDVNIADSAVVVNETTGAVTVDSLAAGAGTQMVTADSAGVLGYAAIPSGLTDVAAGTGIRLTGTTTKTIYSTLAEGKSGGQSVIGGSGAGEDLAVSSTSHGTKGSITIGGSEIVVDEAGQTTAVGSLSGSDDTGVGVDDDGVLRNIPLNHNLGTYQFGGALTIGTFLVTGMYWKNANDQQSTSEWGYRNASSRTANAARVSVYVWANSLDGTMNIKLYKNGSVISTMAVFAAGVTGTQDIVTGGAEVNSITYAPGDRVEIFVVSSSAPNLITTGAVDLSVTVQLLEETSL